MSKNLVIVESPAKAKTIKRFLGKEFDVEASMGHVRDLPSHTLAVDTEHDFEPEYEIPEEKAAVVKRLRAAYRTADTLWIATDGDREGEAIGWHLTQVLKTKKPVHLHRIIFHEITEGAIKEAIESPRKLNMKLVDAQQARRVLDRIVGYTLSPFLWKKVYRGLSAGRVQSVAVRIIVDREREIRAFKPVEYWSLEAQLETSTSEQFSALLHRKNGKKIDVESKAASDAVLKDLEGAQYRVAEIEEKELKRAPPPPFTTSTLQQEGARKLGFSVKQTMAVAQQLYEGVSLGKGEGHMGLITYMRTDSVNLSAKALSDSARVIEQHFGREYVLSEPRRFRTKSKGAQEAHEAIRPTELERTPQSLSSVLDHQQLKLYTLIWNRTMATQMPVAELRRVGVDIEASRSGAPPYTFRATGQTVTFDGYYRVYKEDRDEVESGKMKEDSDDDNEKFLPMLTKNQALEFLELRPDQHFTKPPPRYTEASLVKKMEEEGIGRPSTYAPTISTVQQRGYIVREGKQLAPQESAFMVTDLLEEHFPAIVDLAFTAKMEQSLDNIAEGNESSAEFLRSFYRPFAALVKKKSGEIQKSDVLKERVLGTDPATHKEVLVRTGRFGPYVQLGRFESEAKATGKGKGTGKGPKTAKPKLRSASIPKHILMDAITLPQALSLLSFPRELGMHDGHQVIVAFGRFGPYMRCGEATVSLKDCKVDLLMMTLADALEILTAAKDQRKKSQEALRTLGSDPHTGGTILVKIGRYGPYLTDGKTNASLSKKIDPQTVTLETAAEILAKKRARGPSTWRRRG